jgi:hypothetical protein
MSRAPPNQSIMMGSHMSILQIDFGQAVSTSKAKNIVEASASSMSLGTSLYVAMFLYRLPLKITVLHFPHFAKIERS